SSGSYSPKPPQQFKRLGGFALWHRYMKFDERYLVVGLTLRSEKKAELDYSNQLGFTRLT
ncbi:MAG: hypothetical protein K2Q97_18650, partial [Burkholderiaceae bacterium]|nr:hypothetical protein [Burkholderiaceae bacterium]